MKNQVCARWGPRKGTTTGDAVLFGLEADSKPTELYLEHVYPLIEKLLDVKFKQEDVEKNATGFAEWVRESLEGKYDEARYRSIWITCEGQWVELYLSDEVPIVRGAMRRFWRRIKPYLSNEG